MDRCYQGNPVGLRVSTSTQWKINQKKRIETRKLRADSSRSEINWFSLPAPSTVYPTPNIFSVRPDMFVYIAALYLLIVSNFTASHLTVLVECILVQFSSMYLFSFLLFCGYLRQIQTYIHVCVWGLLKAKQSYSHIHKYLHALIERRLFTMATVDRYILSALFSITGRNYFWTLSWNWTPKRWLTAPEIDR